MVDLNEKILVPTKCMNSEHIFSKSGTQLTIIVWGRCLFSSGWWCDPELLDIPGVVFDVVISMLTCSICDKAL